MIRKLSALMLAPVFLAPLALAGLVHAQEEAAPRRLPAPALHLPAPSQPGLKTAVFSGGCFWGVQGVFSHVRGVERAVSGYTGGVEATANYPDVSTGRTGQAESVQVTYDPHKVTYDQLMRVFFSVALDPTQLNRQGPDDGSQYRSVLWVQTPRQRQEATAYIRQLDSAHAFSAPVVTKVADLKTFWPAESYHQNFMARHPDNPYIQEWDVQKVAALKTLYPDLFTPSVSAA